jgi:hypothetical protein
MVNLGHHPENTTDEGPIRRTREGGSEWELSFAGGVEPVLPPLEEPVCSICIAFLCAFLAFGMAYVT